MSIILTRLKRTSLLLFYVLITTTLMAQQNGGMESWSPSGSPPPFDWKFPTGWTTNNATTEFITAGVSRSTYHYSGEFGAQIKTLNIFGTLTRSQLALGNCKLDFPNYQVKAYTGGESLSMIPHEVSFYYQLTIGDPAEYAVADVLIKRGSGSAVPDTVYHTSVALPGVGIYTEMNVPIPDVGIHVATDSIVILFSSNDTNEIASNILYIDDVSIDFSTSFQPTPDPASVIRLYPNPIRNGETLIIQSPQTSVTQIQLFDSSGKSVETCFKIISSADGLYLQPHQLRPGLYYIMIDDQYGSRFVLTE